MVDLKVLCNCKGANCHKDFADCGSKLQCAKIVLIFLLVILNLQSCTKFYLNLKMMISPTLIKQSALRYRENVFVIFTGFILSGDFNFHALYYN